MISDKTALRAISTFWNRHGHAPALGDIAAALRISLGSAANLVSDLQAKGLVDREPHKSRTMRLTILGIEALEGEVPMRPLTAEALAELGPMQVIRHMTPRHVECSGLLQAVVES